MGRTMGSVLDQKGTVWVFGENSQGELGVGDTTPRLSPYPIVSLQNKGVSQVALGNGYSIALTGGQRESRIEVLSENKTLLNTCIAPPQSEETFGISPEEKVSTPHQLVKPQPFKRNQQPTIDLAQRPKSTYVLPTQAGLL